MLGLGGEEPVQDLAGLALLREARVARGSGRDEHLGVKDRRFVIIRETPREVLERGAVRDGTGAVIGLVAVGVKGVDRGDVALLPVRLRPESGGLFGGGAAGGELRWSGRRPDRVVVRRRDAPVRHPALGVLRRDLRERGARLFIPERVEQRDGPREGGLELRLAGERELDRAEGFAAVHVLAVVLLRADEGGRSDKRREDNARELS